MAIRTPDWWYRRGAAGAPWWRPILFPLSWLWRAVNAVKRLTAQPYQSSVFVISIGNLTLGGSGKTPVAAEVLRLLSDRKIAGLSKGYGGDFDGPIWVDAKTHAAAQIGDEPLMLAAHAPILVAKDRAAGLRQMEQDGIDIAVIDDAHQNLKIAKDLHILVVDGDTRDGAWPFGDGGVCPYGPMREPFAEGLARADLCVLWLPDESAEPDTDLLALLAPKPVFIARLIAQRPDVTGRVLAFAGIAKPWKFETTLQKLGYKLSGFRSFPDHVSPSQADLEVMAQTAEADHSQLMTTEKDWVRLDPVWRERVTCLPIAARFDDVEGFATALVIAISGHA